MWCPFLLRTVPRRRSLAQDVWRVTQPGPPVRRSWLGSRIEVAPLRYGFACPTAPTVRRLRRRISLREPTSGSWIPPFRQTERGSSTSRLTRWGLTGYGYRRFQADHQSASPTPSQAGNSAALGRPTAAGSSTFSIKAARIL